MKAMMTSMTRIPPRTLIRLRERPVYWKPVCSSSTPTILSPACGWGQHEVTDVRQDLTSSLDFQTRKSWIEIIHKKGKSEVFPADIHILHPRRFLNEFCGMFQTCISDHWGNIKVLTRVGNFHFTKSLAKTADKKQRNLWKNKWIGPWIFLYI